MMFGAIASFLRYNVFPHPLSGMFAITFGIPPLSLFGDFSDISPSELAEISLRTLMLFFEKLRVKIIPPKSEFPRKAAALVLDGIPPSRRTAPSRQSDSRMKRSAMARPDQCLFREGRNSARRTGEVGREAWVPKKQACSVNSIELRYSRFIVSSTLDAPRQSYLVMNRIF